MADSAGGFKRNRRLAVCPRSTEVSVEASQELAANAADSASKMVREFTNSGLWDNPRNTRREADQNDFQTVSSRVIDGVLGGPVTDDLSRFVPHLFVK